MSDPTTTPTPTNEQQDARGEHIVTVEFEEGYGQHVRMACHAPADSTCHARYDCECEQWMDEGVDDGRPWHVTDDDADEPERHYGRIDPTYCNLREFFDASDDPMSGSVSFAVRQTWEGDYYSFKPIDPTPLAAVSAAAGPTPTNEQQDARAFDQAPYLARALNWASIDALANTPDYVLAEKLAGCPHLDAMFRAYLAAVSAQAGIESPPEPEPDPLAGRLPAPEGPLQVEYGLVWDDRGSADTFPTLEQARAVARELDEPVQVVRIETWPVADEVAS